MASFRQKGAYGQVAFASSHFAAPLTMPMGEQQPFKVEGKINDDDLIAIVDFIRSNPISSETIDHPDGTSTTQMQGTVDGENQILSIELKVNKRYPAFKITTERRDGAGQEIYIFRKRDKWKISSIAQWVA